MRKRPSGHGSTGRGGKSELDVIGVEPDRIDFNELLRLGGAESCRVPRKGSMKRSGLEAKPLRLSKRPSGPFGKGRGGMSGLDAIGTEPGWISFNELVWFGGAESCRVPRKRSMKQSGLDNKPLRLVKRSSDRFSKGLGGRSSLDAIGTEPG